MPIVSKGSLFPVLGCSTSCVLKGAQTLRPCTSQLRNSNDLFAVRPIYKLWYLKAYEPVRRLLGPEYCQCDDASCQK